MWGCMCTCLCVYIAQICSSTAPFFPLSGHLLVSNTLLYTFLFSDFLSLSLSHPLFHICTYVYMHMTHIYIYTHLYICMIHTLVCIWDIYIYIYTLLTYIPYVRENKRHFIFILFFSILILFYWNCLVF